jgi:hypothetical protein
MSRRSPTTVMGNSKRTYTFENGTQIGERSFTIHLTTDEIHTNHLKALGTLLKNQNQIEAGKMFNQTITVSADNHHSKWTAENIISRTLRQTLISNVSMYWKNIVYVTMTQWLPKNGNMKQGTYKIKNNDSKTTVMDQLAQILMLREKDRLSYMAKEIPFNQYPHFPKVS